MLKKNYNHNYLRIYIWKFFSILTGFLSLLIVVPHLSSDKELYGIYSVCISFIIYLSYADIGFLSAGQKYAAEAFAKNDRNTEIRLLGFIGAILLLMTIPFSLSMIFFSFQPDMLIHNLTENGKDISKSILLILGTLLPFQIILQRLVQSILIIRIKDYISLRIDVIFNLVKVGSVFYFFSENSYQLVEYFLFVNAITILSSLVILFIIKINENYDFLLLFKSIKVKKKEYNITKKLAGSSLILTIGWLIYYELDLIIIGKWLGPQDVAIYAVAFTFLNFLRTLWNTVFSPFAQRFNHFSALNSDLELRELTKRIMDYTFPLCIIVTIALILASEKIIYYWVGNDYADSIVILQVLIVGTCFGFVTNPASYYFTAKTKYSLMNALGMVLPMIFIIGIFLLIPNFSLVGISISKSFTMLIGFIICFIGVSRIYNPLLSIKKWFINLLIMITFTSFLISHILDVFFISQEKSTTNLVLLFLMLACVVVVSYLVLLLTMREQRMDLKVILSSLFRKIN